MPIDSARLSELAGRAKTYLEATYHVPVLVRAIPKPFHGDLDGADGVVIWEDGRALAPLAGRGWPKAG